MQTIEKSDEEWRAELTPEQYLVCRECGTEPAFTGLYWDCHDHGIYRCIACGLELFDSERKYDSGSGWPSFWQPIDPAHITLVDDESYGVERVAVCCSRCEAHLGHVFADGPKPTGLRYCINSAALALDRS